MMGQHLRSRFHYSNPAAVRVHHPKFSGEPRTFINVRC